nr:MAG TPA: hypothetical protein [Caudoviricetes sp.]
MGYQCYRTGIAIRRISTNFRQFQQTYQRTGKAYIVRKSGNRQ